jgi:hypothetical protein
MLLRITLKIFWFYHDKIYYMSRSINLSPKFLRTTLQIIIKSLYEAWNCNVIVKTNIQQLLTCFYPFSQAMKCYQYLITHCCGFISLHHHQISQFVLCISHICIYAHIRTL